MKTMEEKIIRAYKKKSNLFSQLRCQTTSHACLSFIRRGLFYNAGCRILNIIHTRLRHRSSSLNADLFRVHLANDPGCICGCAFEDAIHFILECCLYNEARKELRLRLVFLHELKIEVLLFGGDTLTEMQNLQIFKSV